PMPGPLPDPRPAPSPVPAPPPLPGPLLGAAAGVGSGTPIRSCMSAGADTIGATSTGNGSDCRVGGGAGSGGVGTGSIGFGGCRTGSGLLTRALPVLRIFGAGFG